MRTPRRAELGLDGVLYIPAGVPAFKVGLTSAPAADRLRMVELAVAGRAGCAVSAREIERPGVTYTADTLVELRRDVPDGVRLVFIWGGRVRVVASWHDAATVARFAELACAPRAGHDAPLAVERLRARMPECRVHLLEGRVPDVSSTQVRRLLAEGRPTEGLLDPAVARHIAERGLYGTDTNGKARRDGA